NKPRRRSPLNANAPAASTTATTVAATAVTRTRIDGCGQRCVRLPPTRINAVAVAPDRLDRLPPERHVDLLAEVPDVDLDHIRVHFGAFVPHVLQQRRLGLHLAAVDGQVGEQLELLGRQCDQLARPRALASGEVDAQVSQLYDV